MGSESENLVDVHDTVFVAVGKHIKECESTVLWAANSIFGKKICLLYVHQPLRFSFFDGKFLSSKLKQRSFKAFHELEEQKIHKLLNQYALLLSEAKVPSVSRVQVDKIWIEMDNVEEGIVKFIVEHGVRWLVMGGAADKHHTSDLAELTSKKAIFVCEQAPASCQIWFVCKGCQIYTRESRKDGPFEESSPEWLHLSSSSSEDVQTEEHESARLDHMANEREPFPRLKLRELSSILRANSLDLGFSVPHDTALTSPCSTKSMPSTSNVRDDGHELMLSLSKGKMTRKIRLTTVREINGRLERAISGSQKLKQLVFEESIKRWRAEENAMEAKRQAVVAEKLYMEREQRKEMEDVLEKQKKEIEMIKDACEQCTEDLQVVCCQSSVLKEQITEARCTTKELEERFLSAVDLLISFKEKRDQLRVEHTEAIEEMRGLQKWKVDTFACLCSPEFSNFSFSEINEATSSFDPSKRIGGGRYASVYEGILRHMKVVIKMLPNDRSLSQLDFEQKAEVLSRLRHPNLVTLLGISSESRSIIYEYIEKGSLEDQLNCRNKKALLWQTRVRIMAELCSVVIFLKTNDPPIIHGNLKPTKILLDTNLVSKICDLGISRLISQHQISRYSDCNQNDSSIYIDPEFLETGKLTPESDVYSFGVILLRLLTGRPAVGVVKDVRCALGNDNIENLLDSSAGKWPVHQAKRLAALAVRCCERNCMDRPDIASDVWSVLDELRRDSANASRSCSSSEEKPRVPSHFVCPIFKEVMKDPLIAADGYTYEGEAIREWLDSGHHTSPMTNLKLPSYDLIPNHTLYYAIQDYLQTSS